MAKRPGLSPAYELKFRLTEDSAKRVEADVAADLQRDPHGDPSLGGDYLISSVYCDTPDWAVYHRIGSHRYRKYRLRRYGDASEVFWERKSRRGMQVRKRRAIAPAVDPTAWRGPLSDPKWGAAHFAHEVARLGLRPTVLVAYRRRAFVGTIEGRAVRCTIDRGMVASPWTEWSPRHPTMAIRVLPGEAVLELKWRGSLPARWKEIISLVGVPAGGVSKYRRAVDSLAILQGPREVQRDAAARSDHA